eukprot:1909271-Amphidinium_carterae.2
MSQSETKKQALTYCRSLGPPSSPPSFILAHQPGANCQGTLVGKQPRRRVPKVQQMQTLSSTCSSKSELTGTHFGTTHLSRPVQAEMTPRTPRWIGMRGCEL